jgi:hypothetical protein
VGQGRGIRALNVDRSDNKHYRFIVNKLARHGLWVTVCIVKEHLTEKQAFTLERRLIRKYGRKDLGRGHLANQTDGGEGSSGTIVCEETRALFRKQRRGVPKSPEHRVKLAANCRRIGSTPEARERLAERNRNFSWAKGVKRRSETLVKMREAQRVRRERERLVNGDGYAMSAVTRAKLSLPRRRRRLPIIGVE